MSDCVEDGASCRQLLHDCARASLKTHLTSQLLLSSHVIVIVSSLISMDESIEQCVIWMQLLQLYT